MPIKKNKYNARFPPARIKKIMQIDEEIGKVAAAVPVIISRSLEMFVEHLLKKTYEISTNRGARTLTPSHIKMCIASESRFDFLKDLVSAVPDLQGDSDDQPPTPISTPTTAPSFNTHFSSQQTKALVTTAQSSKQTLPPLDRQLSTPKVRGRKRKTAVDFVDDVPPQSKETKLKKVVLSKQSKASQKGLKNPPKIGGKRGRKKKSQFIDDDKKEEDVQIPPQTSLDKNDCNIIDDNDDEEDEISAPISLNGEELKPKPVSTSEVTTQVMSKQIAITEETLSVSKTVSENSESTPTETTTAPTVATTVTRKPTLLETKANSFSCPATTTVPLKPVRFNHIPMHLVSATAMATAKPTTFHRSRSFHDSKSMAQRSDPAKSGPFAFSLRYPVPLPRSAVPESKTQMSGPTSSGLTNRITVDQQGESDQPKTSGIKSVSWSSHGSVDEDYDA